MRHKSTNNKGAKSQTDRQIGSKILTANRKEINENKYPEISKYKC